MLSDRVGVESLRDYLLVYDMMTCENNKFIAVQVYRQLFGIKDEQKYLDLFTDARSERGMFEVVQLGGRP